MTTNTIPSVSPTIAPTVSASGSTTSGTNSSSSGVLSFTQNFNTFLTLLTTQLQNQDPLSPMDTDTFTQQLVEFSQVEQQINTNNNLQSLISLQTAGETISSLPLVGDQIEYTGATAPLENGQASFSYSLPTAAAQTELVVENSSGNVVYATTGGTSTGSQSFVWNGQTNSGQQLPDGGAYTLQVVSTDASNNPITATIQSVGTVSSVSVNNGQATFNVDGISVPMSQLITVNPSTTANN
jgi:flagellar basal-body rod modification protein FlgD